MNRLSIMADVSHDSDDAPTLQQTLGKATEQTTSSYSYHSMKEPLTAFEKTLLAALPDTVAIQSFRSFEAWYVGHVSDHANADELRARVVDAWLNLNIKHYSWTFSP